jgi:hypothetical protein
MFPQVFYLLGYNAIENHPTFHRRHIPPKRRLSLSGLLVISHKIKFFITTAVRIVNPKVSKAIPETGRGGP